MGFIKDFECRSCGSTLGKYVRGTKTLAYCFLCGASRHDILLADHECRGLNYEEMQQLLGVEPGSNGEVIERLHTPGAYYQHSLKSPKALLADGLRYRFEPDVSRAEIEQVIKTMEVMIEEHRNATDKINTSDENHCCTETSSKRCGEKRLVFESGTEKVCRKKTKAIPAPTSDNKSREGQRGGV